MARLRQDLTEKPDITEPLDLEVGDIDSKTRVDQPARGTTADPDARTAGVFNRRCGLHRRGSVAIGPYGWAARSLGR